MSLTLCELLFDCRKLSGDLTQFLQNVFVGKLFPSCLLFPFTVEVVTRFLERMKMSNVDFSQYIARRSAMSHTHQSLRKPKFCAMHQRQQSESCTAASGTAARDRFGPKAPVGLISVNGGFVPHSRPWQLPQRMSARSPEQTCFGADIRSCSNVIDQIISCGAARKTDIGRDRSEVRRGHDRVAGLCCRSRS